MNKSHSNKIAYDAPALQKGLDVLECLATLPRAINLSELSTQLERSNSELYRTVIVLERRGYLLVERKQIKLTRKAFDLGLSAPSIQNIIETARPILYKLSENIGTCAYLSLSSDNTVIVIATNPCPNEYGLNVKVGARWPSSNSASGRVHSAFLSEERKAEISLKYRHETDAEEALVEVKTHGWAEYRNPAYPVVTELSFPVVAPENRVLAISIPLLIGEDGLPVDFYKPVLRQAAIDLTIELNRK